MTTRNFFNRQAWFITMLILPAMAITTIMMPSCSSRKKAQNAPPTAAQVAKEPFVVVEEMPLFPGGDSALLAYISQNTKYPETAKKNLVQGRVIVRFCVTRTGGIDKIAVLKGVNPELDAESIRVVSSLPAFQPGKQGGEPVDVWYMVPITFTLSKESAGKEAVKD